MLSLNRSALLATILLCVSLGVGLVLQMRSGQAQASYSLMVSTSSNRSSTAALAGRNVSGNIYVFTSPSSGVSRVQFFLDDPDMSGPPIKTEKESPSDFAGTATSGEAKPFNTATVVDGSHTITAKLSLSGGNTKVLNATFNTR